MVLFLAGIFTLANVAIRGAVTLHYFKYFVGDDGSAWLGVFDLTTVFMTSSALALIAGVACTPWFTRFAGKRELMIWLSAANALAMASFFFIPPDAITLMLVMNIVGTFIIGPTPALVWAMFADTADYGLWKLGHRSTALVFSAAQFAQKMGLTVGGFLAGWVLAGFGFVANTTQTDSGMLGIRLLFTLVPAGFALAGVLAIWFYPLREADVRQMEADLASRADD